MTMILILDRVWNLVSLYLKEKALKLDQTTSKMVLKPRDVISLKPPDAWNLRFPVCSYGEVLKEF